MNFPVANYWHNETRWVSEFFYDRWKNEISLFSEIKSFVPYGNKATRSSLRFATFIVRVELTQGASEAKKVDNDYLRRFSADVDR